jgi:hypothetical protein
MMRLLSFSVFAVSIMMAQTVGLPEYGIQLTGTVLSPVVVNNSSHRILAFTLQWEESGVRSGQETTNFLLQFRSAELRRRGAGVGPGESYGKDIAPIPPPEVRTAGGEPPHAHATKVWLDSALFDNGLLVGPDLSNTFDALTRFVQAELAVHSLLLSADKTSREAAWSKIGEIAATQPNPPGDPVAGHAQYLAAFVAHNAAEELLRVRDRAGEAAAIALAASTQAYPKIRKE